MARISRPPGFDMTYRPDRREAFRPPLAETWMSWAYGLLALGVAAAIVWGQNAHSSSWIFQYVVEGDRHRVVPSSVCAMLLFCSALGVLLREGLRGVVVTPEGVETREIYAVSLPRVRKLAWSQIDRMVVPAAAGKSRGIALDLWDGQRLWLPPVQRPLDLALILERVALARAIPIEGGTGLVDDLGNPLED